MVRHTDDKVAQTFAEANKTQPKARNVERTVAERAKELLAGLRGDAGAVPGTAILATPMPFAAMGAGGAPPVSQAALTAGLAARGAQGPQNALVREAGSRLRIGDSRAAEELLDRRLEETPNDALALRFRALTRRQMRDFGPSARDAEAALALAPADWRARRVLIDDQLDLGLSREALAIANEGLKLDPRSAPLLAARANVWATLGDREHELADLKEAAALDSQFDQAYQSAVASGPGLTTTAAGRPRAGVVWLGAVGIALFCFSVVLFRRRGDSSVRLAMRAEDHAVLARGGRAEAAPMGFKIVRTLGQGGMGVVYEALDVGLQRTVALKKLRAEIADNPRERARFLKEARLVASLKHPNIVEIHAIHEDAEGLFLVFEKVDGVTLHERMSGGGLALPEAAGYLRQIARALDHAHGLGIVHQDLKPANVMVDGGWAKVMDFGIARRVAETMSTMSSLEVVGTPAYMAPEQERGGVIGPPADVYALGVCAYELLTGRTPFPSGGTMMKAQRMFRPASEVRPGLPPEADAAILRALDPEPSGRWPNATMFAETLARAVA